MRGPSHWQWLHRLYARTQPWQVTQKEVAFLASSQERKRQASALCTFLIVGPFNPFKTALEPFKGISLDVAPGKGVVPAYRNILHCHLEQLFTFFFFSAHSGLYSYYTEGQKKGGRDKQTQKQREQTENAVIIRERTDTNAANALCPKVLRWGEEVQKPALNIYSASTFFFFFLLAFQYLSRQNLKRHTSSWLRARLWLSSVIKERWVRRFVCTVEGKIKLIYCAQTGWWIGCNKHF